MIIFKRQLVFLILPLSTLILGLVVLLLSRTARNRGKSVPFAILYGVGVTIWLSSLHYTSVIANTILAHRISFATAYVLVGGALGLALSFPNTALALKTKCILAIDAAVGLSAIILILFSNTVIASDNFYGVHVRPFSLLGDIYLLIVALHLVSAVVVFVYRYLKEVKNRLYFNYIVLAFLITVLIAGTTNLVFPLLGITSLTLAGPFVALLPFITIVYALGISSINDIRYTIAQLLQVTIRLSLMVAFLVSGLVLHVSFGMAYFSAVWVGLNIVIAAAGVSLFYLFADRLESLIDRKIIYASQSPERITNTLLAGFGGEATLSGNASLVSKVIKDAIGVKEVAIVLRTDEGWYWQTGGFSISNSEFDILSERFLKDSATLPTPVFQQRENLLAHSSEIRSLVKQKEIYGIMPMRTKTEIAGFYVLGSKFSQDIFTRQDIFLMETIAKIADLSIERALFYDRIQTFNMTLQQKVDDATKNLRRTNQRLHDLDETKDDFISMASHQLRTPLTSVKGYLSMVLDGDAGALNDTQAKMLRQAFTSSQRMVFLITDLLNISRLKTGKFVIDATPGDLSLLAQEEVDQLSETAELKQITLTYEKPASFPQLMLDETKTRQVIMNFIDNAIYYTPNGGHIRVELLDKPSTVELRVIDDGMGVPRSEQPHLFTKFYRATNARKARPDGTGLGLFMAKKAIAAQGGSIIFSSRERHGSTFGFLFSKSHLCPAEHMLQSPAHAVAVEPKIR